MIIETHGWVSDRILLLGREESCIYLLKGEGEYAILGGGMTYIIPDVLNQLREFNIEENKINRIIILHSHFDHCGIVPFFKKRWPWVKVTASLRAKELLARTDVIERIGRLNRMLLTEKGMEKQAVERGFEFGGIDVEDVVREKDVIACGDLSMEIIDTPGHSSCSIALYVPLEKAMFASDAGGIPLKDKIFTAANSNFDKYIDSLKKMDRYKINVYLAEHYGAKTGDDGRLYLKRSIKAAQETRDILEALYNKTGDIQKSTEEVTDRFMQWIPNDFMPREIIAMVVGQMLRYIAATK